MSFVHQEKNWRKSMQYTLQLWSEFKWPIFECFENRRDASNPRCCKNAVQMPLHHKYRSFDVWRIYIGFGRTRLVYLSDWRWKASLLSSCSNKLDISFPALAYALIINTPTSCVWPGRVSIWFETCKPVALRKVYVFSRFLHSLRNA